MDKNIRYTLEIKTSNLVLEFKTLLFGLWTLEVKNTTLIIGNLRNISRTGKSPSFLMFEYRVYAYVKQRIFHKFIEINFSFGFVVLKWFFLSSPKVKLDCTWNKKNYLRDNDTASKSSQRLSRSLADISVSGNKGDLSSQHDISGPGNFDYFLVS